MIPGARVAAAIEALDAIGTGVPAEQALTAWARGSRYAGSKDRAAVRDHVFDALRMRRSLGDGDGRSLMLQLALREGWDIPALFSGEGHAPAAPDPAELTPFQPPSISAACDIPDWLWPAWQASLGEHAEAAARALQRRAPVFLRVNRRLTTRDAAAAALEAEGIATTPHPEVATCLEVTANPRRVKSSDAFAKGWIELQDASSQWAVGQLPLGSAEWVLDYCAGGGGKALAIADTFDAEVFAHDIASQRMRDLPERAARAGVEIKTLAGGALASAGPFDLVFCDAPCSGSGTWRRTPDAKWRLTRERLDALMQSQDEVLNAARQLVRPGGILAYASCSVLASENSERIQMFIKQNPEWSLVQSGSRLPDDRGDGFFLAVMKNNQ